MYAFIGCDTVSLFAGRGKLRAWETWKVFNEVTPIFKYLSSNYENHCLTEEQTQVLERYVCLLYCKTTVLSNVNECRRMLFTQNGRDVDNIPQQKMLYCSI